MEIPPDVLFSGVGYSFDYPSGTPGLPTWVIVSYLLFDFNYISFLAQDDDGDYDDDEEEDEEEDEYSYEEEPESDGDGSDDDIE